MIPDYSGGRFPPCFASRAQYREWIELSTGYVSHQYSVPPRPAPFAHIPNFCIDCTPTYQAEMIAARRCDFPGVQFRRPPSGGGLVGMTLPPGSRRRVA